MIKIVKTTYKEIKDFNKQEWAEADLEHYGQEVDWKEKKLIFKAIEKDKVVGTVRFNFQAGVTYIHTIIVAKDKRKAGIGKLLMDKAEETAKRLNSHKIYLITGKDWNAVKFYQSLGYRKTGLYQNHYIKKDFIEFSKFI